MSDFDAPLTQLVRRLQVNNDRHYLKILKSLELFDEANICSIVVGYIYFPCTLTSEEIPCGRDFPCGRIIDRIVAPELTHQVGGLTSTLTCSGGTSDPAGLTVGLAGVRFCFPSIPKFVSLTSALFVGLTPLSAPYRHTAITSAESTFTSIHIHRQETWLHETKVCSGVNRMAYIDLLYDSLKNEMTVKVAHAQDETSTDVQFMTVTIAVNQLFGKKLFPVISYHPPLDVSVHAIL